MFGLRSMCLHGCWPVDTNPAPSSMAPRCAGGAPRRLGAGGIDGRLAVGGPVGGGVGRSAVGWADWRWAGRRSLSCRASRRVRSSPHRHDRRPARQGGPMSIAATDTDGQDVEEAGFRRRVRACLEANVPLRTDGDGGRRAADPEGVDAARAYQAALYEAGLAGLTWPKEYGGQGRSPGATRPSSTRRPPATPPPNGSTPSASACAYQPSSPTGPKPTSSATSARRPRVREIWCQLFSEPSAGSRRRQPALTPPARDGDEWVLNGQKVWTSGAHHSRVRHCPGPDRSRPAQASRAVDVHPGHGEPRV